MTDDELAARRDERANDGVTYEWPAVVAYARECVVQELREWASRWGDSWLTGEPPGRQLRARAAALAADDRTDPA